MLQGAIIGAIVGGIMALVMILRRRGMRNELIRILKEEGPGSARRYLDRKTPSVGKIRANQLLPQWERMAALALLGDVAALESEMAQHRGTLNVIGQVDSIALLGVAVRSADPTDAVRRLDELATKMEKEGGAFLGLVKKRLRALATLGQALVGQPARLVEARPALDGIANGGGMVQLLVWHALARAVGFHGKNAASEELQGKVRALTSAFDAAPEAARLTN